MYTTCSRAGANSHNSGLRYAILRLLGAEWVPEKVVDNVTAYQRAER